MTKNQCPRGEECDLEVAWKVGRESARDEVAVLRTHVEVVEAALAKTLAALEKIVDPAGYADDPWDIAKTTLEELKGGQ